MPVTWPHGLGETWPHPPGDWQEGAPVDGIGLYRTFVKERPLKYLSSSGP